jgi:hypothetical protein
MMRLRQPERHHGPYYNSDFGSQEGEGKQQKGREEALDERARCFDVCRQA